jgi:two-component system, NarL family, sensor kinase
MSPVRRLLIVAAAWVVPAAWLAVALTAGPSDGTLVSATALTGSARWGSSATVQRAYGDTLLQEGDEVQKIGGHTFGEWVAAGAATDRDVGDVVAYEVRRVSPRGNELDLSLDVTLTRYPLPDALGQNLSTLVAVLLVLLAGSLVFWLAAGTVTAAAFLAGCALLPVGLTSAPCGLGAIDAAGGRGLWPHLVGEAAFAVGLGLLLLAALTFRAPPGWLRARPWVALVVLVVPALGYAVWIGGPARGLTPEAARVQALITIAVPAALAVVPAVLLALTWRYLRAPTRDDVLACRLALLTIVAGLVALLLLGVVPEHVTGQPLLPWGVLVLLLTPAVLAFLVVAIVGYRLDEIEPTVRRALVQAVVAAVFATAFVAIAAGVDQASESSFDSMLAGGVVALLVLPLAVVLQRLVRRAVYGDRDLPQRVVSELRGLDVTTTPGETLTEALALLARRLRLSHASVEVPAADGAEALAASFGDPRGRPVTVDLQAGGHHLGVLRLEVAPNRDPFGPGDRRLLEDVGSQLGGLVQAVLANRELQRSRQRLVTAREEERRRLRRDLHDGLGPSLATMAMNLESVQDLIERDPRRAAELVGRLSDQAREEIAEIRRLVDGLRPPALDQLGLVSALRERAAQDALAARTGESTRPSWRVEATDDVEPLTAAVEVAAYRIAMEAVTNALRHSGGATCTVSLRREDGVLRMRVRDDGGGLAAGRRLGVGLSSMRERAEELGGTCSVTSDAYGVVVDAWLPLGDGVSET